MNQDAPLIFTYQLRLMNFDTLARMPFKLAVVDPDDAKLSPQQITALSAQDKSLWGYISVGEAERYRPYWKEGNWNLNPPDFLLAANPEWPDAHRVRFWDEDWQSLVIARVETLAKQGYAGVYLDVVDTIQVPQVRAAFFAEHPEGDIKQAATDTIVHISQAAKAINPAFKVVMQNGVGLLRTEDMGTLYDPLQPNEALLQAIDGVGKESTFSLGDTYPLPWTDWDARYLEHALQAGKFVIGIEYPTSAAAQDYALERMLEAGYFPYLDVRMTGKPLPINQEVAARVDPALVAKMTEPQVTELLLAPEEIGRSGEDRFVFDLHQPRDTVLSFVDGRDVIELHGTDGGNFETLIAPTLSYVTGGAMVTFASGYTLHILNVRVGELGAEDFIFTD